MTEVRITETSPLICRTNQWIGFYMIETFVMKELRARLLLVFLLCFVPEHPEECANLLILHRILEFPNDSITDGENQKTEK